MKTKLRQWLSRIFKDAIGNGVLIYADGILFYEKLEDELDSILKKYIGQCGQNSAHVAQMEKVDNINS